MDTKIVPMGLMRKTVHQRVRVFPSISLYCESLVCDVCLWIFLILLLSPLSLNILINIYDSVQVSTLLDSTVLTSCLARLRCINAVNAFLDLKLVLQAAVPTNSNAKATDVASASTSVATTTRIALMVLTKPIAVNHPQSSKQTISQQLSASSQELQTGRIFLHVGQQVRARYGNLRWQKRLRRRKWRGRLSGESLWSSGV